MAYALGLPKHLTDLLYDMVDMDYETRGWRTEMQETATRSVRSSFDASGDREVFRCHITHDAAVGRTGRIGRRINALGLEEYTAYFDYDEDDDGVCDVDSSRWYFGHRAARETKIIVTNPSTFRSTTVYKPWRKLRTM